MKRLDDALLLHFPESSAVDGPPVGAMDTLGVEPCDEQNAEASTKYYLAIRLRTE